MHPAEKMSFTERRKYLAVMYRRYHKASPKAIRVAPDAHPLRFWTVVFSPMWSSPEAAL